jgi:exopolysaccharide biosynthesis protein
MSRADPTWIEAAAAFAEGRAVPGWVLDDLMAFSTAFPRGGPPAPAEPRWSGSFEGLEASRPAPLDTEALAGLLTEEHEGRQPAIFARRTTAVEAILEGLGTPAARILRLGLRVRLEGIAEAAGPRLHRVRALADFYYSLAARLRHPEWVENEQHLTDLVAALRWRTVDDGVEHAVIDGLTNGMPVHVNLVRIDPAKVVIDVEDLKAATHVGTSFADAADASAAISGGFFLYSEDDIELPSRRHDAVGLLLREGQVESPPVFRRASFLVAGDVVAIRPVGMADVSVRKDGQRLALTAFTNRARAAVGPDEPSIAVVGSHVVAVGQSLRVPLNGFVASASAETLADVAVGDELSFDAPSVGGEAACAGIAGGPMLVEDGKSVCDMQAEDFWGSAPPITFSQDETGDRNLLARMAVGIDAQGRVLAAAIDGRNVTRALGMTLAGAARLMIRLGCVRAANFDGGSSKRMLVDGRVVDLATTEIVAGEDAVVRVRPVHSAVVFRPRGGRGGC